MRGKRKLGYELTVDISTGPSYSARLGDICDDEDDCTIINANDQIKKLRKEIVAAVKDTFELFKSNL